MPEKIVLSDEDAQQILGHYCLRLRGLWPIRAGTINSNYLVMTDAGPLFLRVCTGKTEADLRFEAELVWHLGSRGVRTPMLWRTRSGGAYVMWRCDRRSLVRPAMLFSWVRGLEKTEAEIDEKAARHVGELLAAFHLAGQSFALRRPGIYALSDIRQRLTRVAADSRAQAELSDLLPKLQAEAARLGSARSQEVPIGLGHNDLFPDNLLFPPRLPKRLDELSKKSGVILDLEQAATVPYIYDVAVALLSFCASLPVEGETQERLGPLRLGPARALCQGYEALRALSAAEWQGLYEELRYAALRFTVTRLTDVSGYGVSVEKPADLAAAAPVSAPVDAKKPPLRLAAVSHSKNYRDFLWRSEALCTLDSDALLSGLR